MKEQMAKEEKKGEEQEEVDIDLNDPDVEQAALKIQAGFKGYQARKEIKDKMSNNEAKEEGVKEEVDIDLNDHEVEKAATKIQVGFKGCKTREEMQKEKEK